jgi:hypothetical protein
VPFIPGAVTGTVVAEAEEKVPVAGAVVAIPGTPHHTVTGEDGGFVLQGVPPGSYPLAVTAAGYGDAVVDNIAVTPGATTAVDVVLRSSVGAIEGTVVDEEGVPLQDALVVLHGLSRVSPEVRTGPLGDYRFDGVPAGTYTMHATGPGYPVTIVDDVVVKPGEVTTVDFVLRHPQDESTETRKDSPAAASYRAI